MNQSTRAVAVFCLWPFTTGAALYCTTLLPNTLFWQGPFSTLLVGLAFIAPCTIGGAMASAVLRNDEDAK